MTEEIDREVIRWQKALEVIQDYRIGKTDPGVALDFLEVLAFRVLQMKGVK